jgi:amino acid permease
MESTTTAVPTTCSYQRGTNCSHHCCCCYSCCGHNGDSSDSRPASDDSFRAERQGALQMTSSLQVIGNTETASLDQKTSAWTAYLHLVKGTVGPGCLSLPWAVSQLGIVYGVVGIGLVALWTSYNCWTVVRLAQYYNSVSLHDEVAETAEVNEVALSNSLPKASATASLTVTAKTPFEVLSCTANAMLVDSDDAAVASLRTTAWTIPCSSSSSLPSLECNADAVTAPSSRRGGDYQSLCPRAGLESDPHCPETPASATLTRVLQQPQLVTYPMIANWLCGPRFEQYTLICMCVQQLAICTVFLSFVATNAQAIAFLSLGATTNASDAATQTDDVDSHRAQYAGLVTLVALIGGILVTALPNLSALAPLTSLGTGLLLTGLALLGTVVAMVSWWWEDRSANDYDDSSIQWSTAPLALCALLYSFEGICLVLPVQSSMRHPEKFAFTFGAAMVTACIVFSVVAAACVAAFGRVTQGSITAFLLQQYQQQNDNGSSNDLSNFLQQHPSIHVLIRLANAAVSLSVLVTYPLQLFPCVELWSSSSSSAPMASARASRRTTPQSSRLSRPVSDQQLELLSLMKIKNEGSDGILPRTDEQHSVLPLVNSLGSNNGRCSLVRCSTSTSADLGDDSERFVLWEDHNSPKGSVGTWENESLGTATWTPLSIKIMLVAVTYVAALAIPHVETLIAVAGAVAGSSTALLIPPALQLAFLHRIRNQDALSHDTCSLEERNWQKSRILSYALFGGGLLFLVIGSVASVRDIVHIYTKSGG